VQKQTSHKKLRGPERKGGEEDFFANRLPYSTEVKQKQTPSSPPSRLTGAEHFFFFIAAYSKEVGEGEIYNVLLGGAECKGGIYIHIHVNIYTFTIKRSGK